MANSPSDPPPYWVFLSFRGEDTRDNITSHLYKNLMDTGVRTFRDDDALPRGEEISTKLLEAIHDSKICVIVFSENYGNSKWCLEELEEIMKRQRNGEVVVVPVFYKVDSSVVRHQTGKFKEDFRKHEERYGAEIVMKWRTALTTACNLFGFDLLSHMNEGDLVQKVEEYVRKKLQPIIDKMYAIQIPANKLTIEHGDDSEIWRWTNDRIPSWWSTDNSGQSSRRIAEVMNEYWLHVAGKYKVSELRAGWKYEVHLLVKLKHNLEMEPLAKLILEVPGGTKQVNRESLFMKPKDEWVEIKLGEFEAQNRKGKLKFSLYVSDDDTIRKKGICILGARIVPVFFKRLNINDC